MKKNLIVAAVAASASLFAATSMAAGGGQVNFTGSITDTACTITNTVANPLDVKLGEYGSKEFTAVGSTTAPMKFSIGLSGCPASVQNASVNFDGTPDGNDTTLLKLTQATGVATGVGIQLYTSDKTELPLFTPSEAITLVEGANNLDFMAAYKSTAATVTAGPANSVANFSIIYN